MYLIIVLSADRAMLMSQWKINSQKIEVFEFLNQIKLQSF